MICLQDICREATNKWGAMTAVNMIGDLRQTTAAGCIPLAKDSGHDKEAAAGSVEGAGAGLGASFVATDCHSFSCPRKITGCQHVAASGKPMVLNGMQDMAARGFASPEDWALASKHDPEVEKFMEGLAQGKMPFQHAHAAPGVNEYTAALFASPSMFYSGVPVMVDGQVMGAFCVIAPSKPENFDTEHSPTEQKAMAARMTVVLEHQLQQKRVAAAQQAMMQQMMMMQQQMLMGGMPAMVGAMPGAMPANPGAMPGMHGGMYMGPGLMAPQPNSMMPGPMMQQQVHAPIPAAYSSAAASGAAGGVAQ